MALDPPVSVRLTTLPAHDCSYLPGRPATTRAFRANHLPGELYHRFMDAGFRRSGTVIYQPVCAACRACVPIRIPVDRFAPNRSQRRCARKNADLLVSVDQPQLSEEKHELYARYVSQRHHRSEVGDVDWESLQAFLYDSPVDTIEFSYRTPAGQLLAIGICDICQQSLSSVYFYFDPEHSQRGLGTFGALEELAFAKKLGIGFYYLGFWVDGCASMQYKAGFHPCQILGESGNWQDL